MFRALVAMLEEVLKALILIFLAWNILLFEKDINDQFGEFHGDSHT